MAVIVSLLRGINVGGAHKVKMDDLRALYESLGMRNAQSYIQSGNVVFETGRKDLRKLSAGLNDAIEQRYGFHADAVLRTLAEMKELLAANPFAARPVDPARNVVIFLAGQLSPEEGAAMRSLCAAPEELHSDGRHLHCHFPDGMGRSKLPMTIEKQLKKLKIVGTGRNWNTVLKLIEIAETLKT
jgi:uncharacterized protein (DUF1697 family)